MGLTFKILGPLEVVRDGERLDIGGPQQRAVLAMLVIDGERLLIGRHRAADLRVDDDTVSLRHAEIRRSGDGYEIVDLGSLNGTSVNGRRVSGSVRLREGDRIVAGRATIVFTGGRQATVVPLRRPQPVGC